MQQVIEKIKLPLLQTKDSSCPDQRESLSNLSAVAWRQKNKIERHFTSQYKHQG